MIYNNNSSGICNFNLGYFYFDSQSLKFDGVIFFPPGFLRNPRLLNSFRLKHFYCPTNAHNVVKRRVIKTFSN
jgi:hypothetical protein